MGPNRRAQERERAKAHAAEQAKRAEAERKAIAATRRLARPSRPGPDRAAHFDARPTLDCPALTQRDSPVSFERWRLVGVAPGSSQRMGESRLG
jgi:hypothetical protein